MKQLTVILSALLLLTAWIDPFSDSVEKGNSSYKNNDHSGALEHYKNAEKYAPDNKKKNMLEFNRGGAHFKLENYDVAAEKFRESIASENPEIQKKALFNMGNSFMKQRKYKEAADSYIKALEIDPGYEKAKKNLEYILKKQKNRDQEGDDKKEGSGKGESENDTESGKNKKNDIQSRNILDSMKNKPVRKQKGKDNGRKYLEKYW